MGQQQYKYTFTLIADTKDAENNMKRVTAETGKLAGGYGSVLTGGNKLTSQLGMLGSGLGKLAIAIGGPVAAISLLKSSIEAVEGPADKFDAFIGGSKEGLFEFQRALVTMDFSSFISRLAEAYEKGKEFTELLDTLTDTSAYTDYIVARKKAESAELQEMIKNKTLDISVRESYASKRLKLEEDIMNRTQDIAQKTFLIEKKHWEDRNKMATEEAIKLYEFVDSLTGDEATKLSEAFKLAEKELGWKNKKGNVEVVMGKTGFSRSSVEAYKQYLDLLRTGEADVLPKLFKAYTNVDKVRGESQREYNASVRETSMLLNAENNAILKLTDTLSDLKDKYNETSAGYKLGTKLGSSKAGYSDLPSGSGKGGKHLSMPEGSDQLRSYTGLSSEEIKNIQIVSDEMERQNILAEELAYTFVDMFRNIDEGFKGMADSLLKELGRIAIQLAAKAAVFGILKLLMPGSGLIAGGIGAFMGFAAPKMAAGGLAYGPTMAEIGEYPGARSNPEVVAPLSKLQGMISSQSNQPSGIKLGLDGQGNLYAWLKYKERHLSNYK